MVAKVVKKRHVPFFYYPEFGFIVNVVISVFFLVKEGLQELVECCNAEFVGNLDLLV